MALQTRPSRKTAKPATSAAHSPAPKLQFDRQIAETLIRYGRMVVARGYIHNTLGNIAIRVPHPSYPHGVAYTKHSGVSLEEMTIDNVVITDIPTNKILYGSVPTSVGHNLNREILRLRPDINAVIHVHHDEMIALFASGAYESFKPISLEYPYVMAKWPHVVPSHLDVEEDVSPIKEFIADTNSILMVRHGITTLGRNVSEAYHRLNTISSEIKRFVLTEMICAMRRTEGKYLTESEVEWMHKVAEGVIYPANLFKV